MYEPYICMLSYNLNGLPNLLSENLDPIHTRIFMLTVLETTFKLVLYLMIIYSAQLLYFKTV